MTKKHILFISLAIILIGISTTFLSEFQTQIAEAQPAERKNDESSSHLQKATFAGGCFWCMEDPFQSQNGIKNAISGYMGGHIKNPTYEQVSSGKSGHLEVIHFQYDPRKISYKELLEIYWRHIDPTDKRGQFTDRGPQYETRIFYHTAYQRLLARRSKQVLEASEIFDEPIVTKIEQADTFYKAEDYHQEYCYLNPEKYAQYKQGSGRPQFLKKIWSNHEDFRIFPDNGWFPSRYTSPSNQELRASLTDRQYRVTQEDDTEPAHNNKYWNNKKSGIYVDIVSGEPLFSSRHKWNSGTGWPHFYKPLVKEHVVFRDDSSFGLTRIEVRSRYANSHLGHIFESDSTPTGKTYCMNSAALEFIPVDQLEARGYGEFLPHFQQKHKQTNTKSP